MPASLLSLPDELLLEVAAYLMIPDRPLEIPSTFGPLNHWSRQRTIYVKPAQLLKEPYAADLFALRSVNRRISDTLSRILCAEASFDFSTFSSVDLMKEDEVVQRNAKLVRSLDISSDFAVHWDDEEGHTSDEERVSDEEYTSDEDVPIGSESGTSIFCRNLRAFPGLTTLALSRQIVTENVMQVIAGMRNLTALTFYVWPSDDDCQGDLETIDFPPLTSIHIWTPRPRDISLIISLRQSLQDICIMNEDCYHSSIWNRGIFFDQGFPNLRSLSLGPFIDDQSDASALRRFVCKHRDTLRELNIDCAHNLWINMSWIHHIIKVMCGIDAEEWEGMDLKWSEQEDRGGSRNPPWGNFVATAFGCVVRESKGHESPGTPREIVEFGLDLVGFGDEDGEHVNDPIPISFFTRMFQEQIFKSIEQMVLILPPVHYDDDSKPDLLKTVFDGFSSAYSELPHLRALSFYVFHEAMHWSPDVRREIMFPRFTILEDLTDLCETHFMEWRNMAPYSGVDWTRYPVFEGQEKLINMWKNEELANVQSVMSGLMRECESLEIVQWWFGNQYCQCDWVWRRVEGKLDEQSSETKTMSLTNELRIPRTSNAPRKDVISALVGRMADYESNLL